MSSYQPVVPTTTHELDEREVSLVEKFRVVRAEHPSHAFMIVSLPPHAMEGDEQQAAVQAAVVAFFAALAAVSR